MTPFAIMSGAVVASATGRNCSWRKKSETIVSIEGGRYNPSVGLALRIAEQFGLAVEELFEIDREQIHE